KDCGCQYVENPIVREYPVAVKQLCICMIVFHDGNRFSCSERTYIVDNALLDCITLPTHFKLFSITHSPTPKFV
ncbi:MAG: hypothetical protein AAFN00_10105, partial [Cyanobacteria bacterium J06558_2]